MRDLQSHAFRPQWKNSLQKTDVQMNVKVEFYLCVSIISGSGVHVRTCVCSLWNWGVNVINCRTEADLR